MDQIDLFKELFMFDKTVREKTLKRQLHTKCKYERKMNAIPNNLSIKYP